MRNFHSSIMLHRDDTQDIQTNKRKHCQAGSSLCLHNKETVGLEDVRGEAFSSQLVHRLTQTSDVTLNCFPLSNYSFAASPGYFFYCSSLICIFPPTTGFHCCSSLRLLLCDSCLISASLYHSVTLLSAKMRLGQLFLNSMIFPTFHQFYRSELSNLCQKQTAQSKTSHITPQSIAQVYLLWLHLTLVPKYFLICISKCQKDIFPVQEGSAMWKTEGQRACICVYKARTWQDCNFYGYVQSLAKQIRSKNRVQLVLAKQLHFIAAIYP